MPTGGICLCNHLFLLFRVSVGYKGQLLINTKQTAKGLLRVGVCDVFVINRGKVDCYLEKSLKAKVLGVNPFVSFYFTRSLQKLAQRRRHHLRFYIAIN